VTLRQATQPLQGSFYHLLGMDDIQMAHEHNHDLNPLEVAVVRARADLKQLAGNSRVEPGGMVATRLAELPADARPLLGKQEAVKKIIRRVSAGQHPIVPESARILLWVTNGLRQLEPIVSAS
ncbi:hypothetical protein LSAT2_032360, partial [Lamellibrachia satsuma]